MVIIGFWCLILFIQLTNSFKSKLSYSTRLNFLQLLIDNGVDLSTNKDGKLLKYLNKRGDATKGFPLNKDTVDITWQIRNTRGDVLHDSFKTLNDSTFQFQIGMQPRQVILGWEIGIKEMLEGEISTFIIHPDYAFGEKGVPNIIQPNETIECEINLVTILPSIVRKYKPVGLNESIKEDLLDKVYSGESPISEEAMKNKVVTEQKAPDQIKYFDPVIHKLDPLQEVVGIGKGHKWEESRSTIEVSIPLPIRNNYELYSKLDVEVMIRSKDISIRLCTGEVLLEGSLEGKILPSQCNWAIINEGDEGIAMASDDSSKRYIIQKIVLNLEKAHGSQDIWASFLNRDEI